MALPTPAAIAGYYDLVAPVVVRHLLGRPAVPTDGRIAIGEPVRIADPDHLRSLLRSGFVGLTAAIPGRLLLRIVPGEGADAATAATVALDLAEQMADDGRVAVPLTDGSGGLLLVSADGVGQGMAHAYAAALARRAPELATLDPNQADGRCLLHTGWELPTEWTLPTEPGGDMESTAGEHWRQQSDDAALSAPVPYSLVSGSDGVAPVIPLHLDEVAAVAAGMPLEMTANDVAGRLTTRGDLASALLADGTA
jgi:hypothetical protein